MRYQTQYKDIQYVEKVYVYEKEEDNALQVIIFTDMTKLTLHQTYFANPLLTLNFW